VNVNVVDVSEHGSVEAARSAALAAGAAPFVIFLHGRDKPAEDLVSSLVRAQAATEADVVSCGLWLDDRRRQHLFLGDPGALGVLSNSYGTVALIRRSLLADLGTAWPVEGDPDWPLLARLHLAGARIVSIPLPLVTRADTPGSLERHPSDALLVVEQHEQALPDGLRPLARLAAGLAATPAQPPAQRNAGIRRLARRLLRR
jgi:hypothetical protein